VALKVKDFAMERKFYVVHNLRRELFPVTVEFSSFIHKQTTRMRKSDSPEE
jgi:hypothetical protein